MVKITIGYDLTGECKMFFLGIDAGGTNTKFVVSDENGVILTEHTGSACKFLEAGKEMLSLFIKKEISILCNKTGININDITYAALGIPGYGEKEGSDIEVKEACESAGLFGKIACECDCYIGWAGSFAMKPGVNIIAGTGSICYGVDASGNTARCSGWGAYCDEGSCRWLGERLIALYTKQADGRMPRTFLYEMFRKHFSINEDLHFIEELNHGLSYSDVADLQRLLSDIYEAGDIHAKELYDRAAKELALAAFTVACNLNFTKPVISYSGGLFKSGEKILKPLSDEINKKGGILTPPRFPPEIGAVIVAMSKVYSYDELQTKINNID